jgi:Opioid growth factor receptor (OGFr) conserved region
MDSPVTEGGIRLIAFYRDGARDDAGRTLDEILAWPDDELEAVHDFIQWLFPLPERSGANPAAPVLDENTIHAFRNSAQMQENLRRAFLRMLAFYGLTWTEGRVARAADFENRAENWLWPSNHNHLRITRMLRSLGLLGLEAESVAFFHALDLIYQNFPQRITARTFAFWRDAALPFSSPQRD